ncbi:MAG: DUF1318 domain-containing protein [Desulfobacterales bacterium]|nr:DUF1318 domain-containing protein [Desulfobacterales bacterium]MDD4072101.1 DUF1318 domain-containing protein [Desulfobacterales bacterium]MDD4393474.1 DUF1318 domain-containing protein [Desulfobacterales bacterium]
MKRRPKFLFTMTAVLLAGLFACVTINIYFPAEKVESVAGDIVDDIRGQKVPQNDKQSKKDEGFFSDIKFALFSSNAWADEVTDVSNPTIRALKEKMKDRFKSLKPYYQKGLLKEGGDGYLSVAGTGGLNLLEKRDLSGLVDAENRDRKTLYVEVAHALKIDDSQIVRIAEIFAGEWQKPVR